MLTKIAVMPQIFYTKMISVNAHRDAYRSFFKANSTWEFRPEDCLWINAQPVSVRS